MKKIILLLSITFTFSLLSYAQNKEKSVKVFGKQISKENISPDGIIRCATNEYEAYLQKNNPKRATDAQFEAWIKPLLQDYKKNRNTYSETGGIITIPVVVHVIHNGDAYGVNENIKDEQVQSQITVMNQDFRRMTGTPGFNSNAIGVDTQIQFELAKVDQNGNPTNGINRVNLCKDAWSTGDIDAIVKPKTSWDPSSYMNMWSIKFSDATLLGYAQFPNASGLGGLNASGGNANTDGVVSNYKSFGSRLIFPAGNYGTGVKYDKGRTMTHEVGHWIGLRHIWGDGGCNVDDFCADTPVAADANFDCATGADSCPASPGTDMVENYMDYSDDSCMNIFTADQKARMVVIMNNSARRASLKASTKNIPIALFALDAEVIIENSCDNTFATCTIPNPSATNKVILLYNRGTSTMTAATISYNMNGGTTYTNNWTGSLAPNQYAKIALNNTNSFGTLNTSIINVNGSTDQRISNNVSSKDFGTIQPIINAQYNSFTFNLVGDPYGTETTWELKNQAGTILYSGGPYNDATVVGTQNFVTNQNWTLPVDCYTFTIYDSYGDGINTPDGAGYWNIKANSGAVTVASGGSFGDSESASFTNSVLSNANFEVLQYVKVYPNPTTNILNISIASSIEIPANYKIINTLGQLVKTENISNREFNINTSEFASGVYLLQLNFNDKSETIRFIKN